MLVCLFFSGEKFSDLSYQYRADERNIYEAIKQTTRAIYSVMKDSYLKISSFPTVCMAANDIRLYISVKIVPKFIIMKLYS